MPGFILWLRGVSRSVGLLLLASVAVRAQTDGAPKWAGPFSTLSSNTAGSIVSSPSVAPDGTIYIGNEIGTSTSTTSGGQLFAIAPNGTQKWVFNGATDWIDSTPAIAPDGTIYFGSWDNNVYALNPNGTKKWSFATHGFVASSPALAADGTIYIGSGDGNLYALNPDGTQKWLYPTTDWIDDAPAVAPDGTIYFGSWNGAVYALAPDGSEKWFFTTGGNVVSSPAIAADGTIYVGSRDTKLYALAPDGSMKWSFPANDTIESAPVLGADGTIYFTSTGGRLYALNRDGSQRWTYPAGTTAALNPIYSSPAVRADGAIIFGTSDNFLYAVRADGTLLWRSALGDWADSSPLIAADGSIYIGCLDKKLYAFTGTSAPTMTDWGQLHRDPQRTGRQWLGGAPATTGRLVNLSVRTFAGAANDTLIVGFYVNGSGSRTLLVRGVGPGLTQFNVSGVLADPQITVYAGQNALATNDNWSAAPNAGAISSTATAVSAFPLQSGSLDAALLSGFSAGAYTVQVTGSGASTGIALLEAYDTGTGATTARLSNVSARSHVSTGGGVLIAGFVVSDNTRAVLVRGIGPALAAAPFNIATALVDPQLRVYRSDGTLVAENNDWSVATNSAAIGATASSVGAFPLASGSRDSALLLTLAPGAYTAQISGVNGATGVGLVELYEVP
jgi:outer membrane protein assembly factor BamB